MTRHKIKAAAAAAIVVTAAAALTKGEQRNVYCDEVGEAAYQASCYRNGEWGRS
jgi:hypothetical protein